MTTKFTAWVVLVIVLVSLGCLVAWFLKLPLGPANPVVARDLIQNVVPASWAAVAANEQQANMTKEYFSDGRVQTLALVGPQINHLRWTDRQGIVHVEDRSKECLLLWIIPGNYKPKFPNFFDHMASGANLPALIFSSKRVCVYGYVTNSGSDHDRIREIDKVCTRFSIDGVDLTWTNWAKDIEHKLTTVSTSDEDL